MDSVTLNSKLSYIWNDIFPLYGWISTGKGSYIHKRSKILVESHNTWNTFNCNDKTNRLQLQRDNKRENNDYEVVFGALVDKTPKDFYTNGNVRVIKGELFREFMLGSDHKRIYTQLQYLIDKFYKEKLRPRLIQLYSDDNTSSIL